MIYRLFISYTLFQVICIGLGKVNKLNIRVARYITRNCDVSPLHPNVVQ